jgi:lipoprotein-anchoring transpeptidase ErfK/SrfK
MDKSNSCSRFLMMVLCACLAFAGISYAAGNTFIFNPNTLSWKAVNENGKVVRTGRASGGKHYCHDTRRGCKTPSGVFRIISKGGPGCVSSRYPLGKGGAPMPWCMFFSKYYAIHGSYDVPNHNASHGCIRVTPSDARWLSHHFVRIGTKVIVRPY